MVTAPTVNHFGPEWDGIQDTYPRYVPIGHTDRGENGTFYVPFRDLSTNWVGWLIKAPGGEVEVCWRA